MSRYPTRAIERWALPRRFRPASFTLVEVLVSMAIFVLLLAVLFEIINQMANVMRQSTREIETFQSARTGFDVMTHTLSQATLNTYLDYDNSLYPTNYLRESDLDFVIGAAGSPFPGTSGTGQAVFFQAPLNYTTNVAGYGGTEALLNTVGYYVSFTTNSGLPAHVQGTSNPWRFRLMQMLVPTEDNTIYTAAGANTWFTAPGLSTTFVTPVADNVIALVLRPQEITNAAPSDITNNYTYDANLNATVYPQPVTAKQLPPLMQVTMVAIDEASAKRLDPGNGTAPAAITSALNNKFAYATNYASDLSQLESNLTTAKIPYKVFTSNVPMRESKWSK